MKIWTPAIGGIGLLLAAPAFGETFEKSVWPFLEKHCVECHDDLSAKGGLDLYAFVDSGISGLEEVQQWTAIFDRIDHDEMPPKKQPRPKSEEKAAFLSGLAIPLREADSSVREVIHRRMNRIEYENTVRDLLGVEIDLQNLLPEDQSAGGFDNNGGALAVSAELFERYLEAARRSLDAAIQTGPRPETRTVKTDSLYEVGAYLDKQYSLIDDRVTVYMNRREQYSKISTRKAKTPEPGLYRFKFTAAAVHSEEPVVFSVTASDFKAVSAVYKNLGYYEVGTEPQEFEIEAVLDKGFAIQFFAQSLPYWVKDPTKGENAGVGWSAVEITGPIIEHWPPASHTGLLGDVDLEKGTLEDAKAILERFMPKAYRRPITEAELSRPLALVGSALEEGRAFLPSLRIGLEAVLCSPNFLFLREEKGSDRINEFELASRLSYFLWNSMPDESLFAVARDGKLSDPETLAGEVERLLKDPRSDRFAENFTGQWLKLREINETTPDRKLYDEFDELLQISMVRESKTFFRKLLDDDLAITNFLDSDFAMLNNRLAENYEIEGVEGLALRPVTLPADSVRGGVLTQGAVLKVTANGTNTSPVMRGIWVLENILGKHLPPPPPNIAGIEPDIREATTIREKLALHANVESCSGCHQYIDPPGFALESFDPIGRYRERYLQFKLNEKFPEKGWGTVVEAKEVDASGVITSGEEFDGIREFKALLLASEQVFAKCLTDRIATYALGREMGFSDREEILNIVRKTAADGNGFRTLISNVVTSPIFQQP